MNDAKLDIKTIILEIIKVVLQPLMNKDKTSSGESEFISLKKGYTAEEIVGSIKQRGSFKNNISIRTKTYKDPEKETGILYQVK